MSFLKKLIANVVREVITDVAIPILVEALTKKKDEQPTTTINVDARGAADPVLVRAQVAQGIQAAMRKPEGGK